MSRGCAVVFSFLDSLDKFGPVLVLFETCLTCLGPSQGLQCTLAWVNLLGHLGVVLVSNELLDETSGAFDTFQNLPPRRGPHTAARSKWQ